MCTVLNTKNLLLHSLLIFAVLIEGFEGIAPDIYTEPSELAFEIFNVNDTSEKSFLLIQPVMEGSITAHLGSYNSTHFYKMASINVFLNSHIVFVYKSHSSPLYALCSLENNYLVAHQNTFILCSFRVYVQSFDTHVFSNSSCAIRTVNESECAAKLDLDFIKMQFHPHVSDTLTLLVKYNATAYQVNQTGHYIHYLERSDITHSLIHQSQVLPPVTAIQKPDFDWSYINYGVSNSSLIRIGIPSIRLNHEFPIRISVDMSFQMQEFRLGIQFGPSIRFIQPRPSRIWGMKTISNQYGINIRFRNKKSDGIYKSGRQINDSSNFINVAELIMAYLGQTDPISQGSHTGSTYMNTGVGVSSGTSSTIPLNSFRSDQLDVNDLHGVDNEIFIENSSVDTDLHFNEDDQHIENKNINNYNDVNDNNNYDYSLNNQPIIQIKLIYFMLRSNSSKIIPYSMNNLINLNVPRLLMHSNNMHIFVQFEPRDIIEPPWFPAISTPEPRKLRIIGLIPQSPALPLDSEKIYSFPFSIPPIGRLVDLTRSVFCRPATSRGLGDNLLEVITSSSPACSISMRQAPPEIENIGSFSNDGFLRDLKVNTFTMAAGGLGMRVGWTDQLVLALPSSVEQNYNIPVAPSIYGSVSLDQQWSWRDWRGPTVRRWMLEGFQIHATKTVLRKIKSWKIPSASSENNHLPHPEVKNRLDSGQDRYEQALITVTARIYTMKPGTGQRIYLGSSFMDKQQFSIPSSTDQFHTHEDGSSEMIFDITRLLPSWALVVKSTKFHQSSVVVDSESPAYLYHDTFNGKPQIIGRRPGKVELNLVATLGDFQPLATLLIDIIDFTELSNQPGSVYTDNPDIVAIKAECIDSSLELSGSLNPAAATHNHDLGLETVSYDSYKKLSSDILDGREYGIPITKIQDYSLPNPHRLNIHLIGRSLKSSNLVTAAASSTIRHPQSFKFKLIQTNQNAARIMDTMRPSVSSAVCPIHLLVINLILSDGSTISAHTVPKNQLRISSYGLPYVWDPAVSVRPIVEEGQQSTNITIPINSLIIWPAILTNKSKTTFHSLPLAIMDDVFVYIRKSGMIEDPGYPQNPLKWFMKDEKDKVSEKMLLPNSKAKNHHIVGSNTGSLLQFNTLLTISNTDNSLKSNNSTNQSVPIITYILIIIGCLIIIILMIICCIIIIFRKKHLKQTKLDDKSQLNALPGYNNNHNNNNNNFNKKINDNTRRLINNDQLILSQLISSTEDQSIQSIIIPEIDRISKSSSECLKNRIQLNSEEICNSINSNKSATFITNNNNNNNNNNNGKHSMIIDTTINPYFICSESLSSNRDQHISQYTYSTNLSPINNLSGLTNYSINYNISTIQDNWNKSNENQSIHSNHQYKIAYYNSENINQCLLWPINNHLDSQLYPKDYTSGLGSVGTVEGCSDEGVASGIEMNSLSQEINNNNNNSNSGIGYFPIKYKLDVNSQQKQTQTTGYRSADESFNGVIHDIGNSITGNQSRDKSIKLKYNLTSTMIPDNNCVCTSGGSLSGMSSGADISEYRQAKGQIDSCYQINKELNNRLSEIVYNSINEKDISLDSYSIPRLSDISRNNNLIHQYSPKSISKNTQMYESFIHHSPQMEQSKDISQKFQKSILLCEGNTIANKQCIDTQEDRLHQPNFTYCSNNCNTYSAIEDYDGFAVHVPPMMLLNNRINSVSVTKPLVNSPLLLNQSYEIIEENSYERNRSSFNYKRSDSFGMATQHGEYLQNNGSTQKLTNDHSDDHTFSVDKQNIFNQDSIQMVGVIDEMIGDGSDVTDDVVIPRNSNDMLVTTGTNSDICMKSEEISYLYKIPPPEV